MIPERLYHLRYRLRDGQQRVWELYSTKGLESKLKLAQAQQVADDLWETGHESVITAVNTEFDNVS